MIREMVQTMMGVKFEAREVVREAREVVRIGIIGVGGRTGFLLNDLLRVEHVQIAALCDTRKDRVVRAQQVIEKAGQKPPALYFGSEHAFESLCQRDDVDIVYIATPWESHAPMAVAAMNNGKHVGVEVPAATTLEECWGLVNTKRDSNTRSGRTWVSGRLSLADTTERISSCAIAWFNGCAKDWRRTWTFTMPQRGVHHGRSARCRSHRAAGRWNSPTLRVGTGKTARKSTWSAWRSKQKN